VQKRVQKRIFGNNNFPSLIPSRAEYLLCKN